MGYENPFSIGYEILRSDSAYSISTHGCSANYCSMCSPDLPSYTGMFYSPTEHEQLSNIKYKRTEIGYHEGLREIHEAIEGIPLEAYIPHTGVLHEGGASLPIVKVVPKKEIKDEIEKAQRDVASQRVVEEVMIDELVLRMIRKRVILRKETRKGVK